MLSVIMSTLDSRPKGPSRRPIICSLKAAIYEIKKIVSVNGLTLVCIWHLLGLTIQTQTIGKSSAGRKAEPFFSDYIQLHKKASSHLIKWWHVTSICQHFMIGGGLTSGSSADPESKRVQRRVPFRVRSHIADPQHIFCVKSAEYNLFITCSN